MKLSRQSGFTIVELTIVLLVMSILAAVAAPRYLEATARFRVKAAAKRIAADLNHVRANANSKGAGVQTEWVSFYETSDNYRLWNYANIDRPGSEYWVHLQQTAYPVDLVLATFTNQNGYTSNDTIKYDMYGTAKSGAPPFIPDAPLVTGQIVVQSGAEQQIVVISPVTGKASVP
ncbi:MAG: prepilin-type N-terminal cleavage/methylation domain-containing protein [Pirellulales bacterium]|nr:prepilin-type N-terminal cleavage/methylation domain-containing protein [Pirellulales bacterium]